MTDRELIEAAARAAGIAGEWGGQEGYIGGRAGFIPAGWLRDWNPLQNDGDALRLAVALYKHGVEIRINECVIGQAVCQVETWCGAYDEDFTVEDDASAATRRAIVRAAAAIGGHPA